jgi:hypothetical protein
MTPNERIAVLRQAYRELEFECSPTAEELGEVIVYLAREWSAELAPLEDYP